jgi:DNA-binding transcriptional LysR family regulator
MSDIMDGRPEDPAQKPFRVTFVTGVTPDKWVGKWRDRTSARLEMLPVEEADQLTAMRSGDADMAFVRLPVDRDGLHVIPLYHEVPVVVVSKEHPVAAYDEIPVSDLADEHLLQDPDDVPAWRDLATEIREGTRYPVPAMTLKQAVESVAAQAGIVIVPMSVARVHRRKDVVAVPVTGVRDTQVGLAWPRDADDPRVEAFIGIVRGRTERSSRGEPAAPAKEQRATKPTKPGGTKARGAHPRKPGSSGRVVKPSRGKRRR